MADALSVIIKTQLELDRKAQISKLNNELSNDKSARLNVVAGLDINKTKDLIKSNLATLSNHTQFNINNITFGKINATQLQNNINQVTSGIKPTIAVAPVLDRKVFSDTESYIKEIVKQLSNPDIANNINFNTILNGLKEKFGLASKDIRTELGNFIQALKLTPNDKQAILNSYQNLMGAIENASGIANGKNFTENISDAIYRLATTFPEVGNKAQQATQSMTEGLKQTEKAAEQVSSAVQKISTSTTANPNYLYQQDNQKLLSFISTLDAEGNAIQDLISKFKAFDENIKITNTELADESGTVQSFVANVKSADGSVEKFTFKLRDLRDIVQIQNGEPPIFKYILTSIAATNEGVENLRQKTTSTAEKMVGDIQRIKTAWETANSGKTVESADHIAKLEEQYRKVESAIERVRSASQSEFAEAKVAAESEKKTLEQLVTLYVKQEKVATSLRAKGIDTNISIKGNEINTFVRQIENSNVPLMAMRENVDSLLTSIQNLIDNPNMDKALKATEFTKVMDNFDIAKSKFKDLQDMFKGFGTVDWLKSNKEQINAFNDLNTKVAVYKKSLEAIQTAWNPETSEQGIKQVSNAFGVLIKNANLIHTENGFETWVQSIDKLIANSEKLRVNLDSQVSVQKQIYQVQSEIAKLNVDPEENKNQLARRQAELENLQKQQTSLMNLSNFYTKLLPIEQQEAYVSEQTRVEREKLLDVEAKIADIQNKNTTQAFDKANTQIVKENLDKIVSDYREIGTLSNQITKGNIGANEVAVNKELIALKEESIKLATEDLEKNGLLTNEIRNQIEAEKQRVAESQKKVQAQVADTAITQQAKALEQQAKAVHTYTTQIQNDLNQLNKMSANTVFTTNTSNPQVQTQKTAIQDLIKEYEKLKATMNSNMSTADLEKARIRLEELGAQLKNANTDMATLRSSMQSDKSAQKLAGDIAILTAQIKQFRSANSKSEARFGTEYDSLLQKLKQNPDVSGLYAIRQQFRQLQGDVRAAGLTGTTFFDKLKADAAKFSAWFGVAAPGMLIAREIRQMFSEVINLDTALFDLRKTFVGTDSDLQEFYYTSNKIAKQLGVTTEEVINSASSWSRLG